MVDQNLLTIFVALTTLAVLIQTGILLGLYFASTKLRRQADHALEATRSILGPVHTAVENLQVVTSRIAEFANATQSQLRQLEQRWRRSA